ncbi:D(1) dopamine receptor-like [Acropora muricata]|uniref:octopamine receptor 1-like n=1 Tax=Acropora millepora TaxID=45264 RepID=UPI001CF3A5A7|nr:octopamine receptor 1-like [Acropora millepora]
MSPLGTQPSNLQNNSLKLSLQLSLTNGSQYPEMCDNPALFATSTVSTTVALCFAFLIPFTLLGNGSVIAAFALNTKLRTATNIFIIGLASSDLLVGTFAIPVWTFIVAHEDIMASYCFSLYYFYISFDVFAGSASILQLTAIALERFISAQWPWFHRKMSRWSYWLMLLFAWLCAALMAAINHVQIKREAWHEIYSIALTALCFVFPFAIIATCYTYIFKISRFQARRRLSSGSNSRHFGSTPGNAIRELNVATTVVVITGVFLASWLPFFVVTILATFCLTCLPSGPALAHLVKCLKFLQYSSSCVNPYIYAYRDKEMRSTIIKVANKIFPCSLARFRTKLKTAKCDSESRNSIDKLQNSEKMNCGKDETVKIKHPLKQRREKSKKSVVIFL